MDILGKTLKELIDLIKRKELSSKEVYRYFYRRSKKYNQKLNVYLTFNEDNKSVGSEEKTQLKGLPIAVKDNYCTKGLRTTASSKVLDSFVPPYSATVIKKLEKAGGKILGKTNMDAWAHGSSTETSDYGPTKNPWDVARVPGGSSGGSSVAVSTYLAPVSIGSETAGSIRGPASWSGVIGLKPTYGRVSRYGVIAMGSSLDCPGPLTLSTEDAALILEIIAGKDVFDATSSSLPVDNYLSFLKEKRKYTVGIADEYFKNCNKEVVKEVEKIIILLKKMGHKIKKIKILDPQYSIADYTVIQRGEVFSNLSRYDGIRYGNKRTFFSEEAKRRMLLGAYSLSIGYSDRYYKQAQRLRTLIIDDFKRIFKKVDFILAPTMPIVAMKLGGFKKYPYFGEMMDVLNEPSAMAGIPAISFPVGSDSKNLPIGAQLMGNYFQEKEILNITYQIEKETNFYDVIKKGIKNYPD